MLNRPTATQATLLALCLLSACAAADPADVPGAASRPVVGGSGELLVARFALRRTDLETASVDYLAALKADPGNADLQQQAFTATVLAGRPEALALARSLPANPAAILLLADADAKAGDWAAAQRRFATLPSNGATEVLRPLLLAWTQQGAGATDDALATLRPLLEVARFRGVFALHAALINDLAGRKPEAAQLYRLATVEYGSLNLRLGTLLASWQARNGQEAEARATIRATVQASPDLTIAEPAMQQAAAVRDVATPANGLAEAYLALAATVRRQDAPEFTQLLLQLALDLRPGFTAARLLTAEMSASGGQFAAAAAALADVPESDPLIALTQLRRAEYLDQAGDTATAQRILGQMADHYQQRPEPLTVLGDMERREGRFAEAAETYGRAIARVGQPGVADWALFYQQGVSYDRAHDWPRAEADLLRALELSPDQPSALNYLGYAWTERGRNIARARQMIERAVEQRPNDGSIVDSLGWVLLQQGDKAGAVRFLERAVELESEDSTINGHLGDAYMAVGRRREAEMQWRRALILNPEPQEAATLNAKLAGAAAAARRPGCSGGGPPSGVMGPLSEAAPAKINLSLLVTGRRDDGYHLLDSVVVFGPVADIVHARPADTLSLTLAGPFAAGLAAEPDNLALRAARALAAWAGRPPGAALVLEKHLPVASGIGGGSADAAATLRVLCRLWQVSPPPEELGRLALCLGADVPVCLASRPARMTGVGEALLPLPPLPRCGLLLANPGVAVSTAEVFRARTAAFSASAALPPARNAASFARALAALGNDLEPPAIRLAPVIGDVLAALRGLPGCLLARMSGSGATCFGLFADPAEAARGAAMLPAGWWRSAGPLYEPGATALLTGDRWGVAKR